jgi:hypothetical protein
LVNDPTKFVERPLNDWERRLIERLASVDAWDPELVRESLPHLVVTGECGCGCPSFNVRDRRFPPQEHELGHYSNGWTEDSAFGFSLWVGPDDRPISVDADDNRPEPSPDGWPDPATLIVKAANDQE